MASKALGDPHSPAHYLLASSPPPLLPLLHLFWPLFLICVRHASASGLCPCCSLYQNSLPPDPACLTPSPPSDLYPYVTSHSSLP